MFSVISNLEAEEKQEIIAATFGGCLVSTEMFLSSPSIKQVKKTVFSLGAVLKHQATL